MCPECGTAGVYEGWGRSTVEMMCSYARLRGLKPTGSHRPFADALLEGVFWPCLRCAGSGYLRSAGDECRACPICDGDGVRPSMSWHEVAALRALILERYPDARSAEKWPPSRRTS